MTNPLTIEALWRRLKLQRAAHADYGRILGELLHVLALTPFGTQAGLCEPALAVGTDEPIGTQTVLALGRHLLVVRLTLEHVPICDDLAARLSVRLLHRQDRNVIDLNAAVPLADLERVCWADRDLSAHDGVASPAARWQLQLLRERSDRPTLTMKDLVDAAPKPDDTPEPLRPALVALRAKLARLEARNDKLLECDSLEEALAVIVTFARIFVTSTVRVVEMGAS